MGISQLDPQHVETNNYMPRQDHQCGRLLGAQHSKELKQIENQGSHPQPQVQAYGQEGYPQVIQLIGQLKCPNDH